MLRFQPTYNNFFKLYLELRPVLGGLFFRDITVVRIISIGRAQFNWQLFYSEGSGDFSKQQKVHCVEIYLLVNYNSVSDKTDCLAV